MKLVVDPVQTKRREIGVPVSLSSKYFRPIYALQPLSVGCSF